MKTLKIFVLLILHGAFKIMVEALLIKSLSKFPIPMNVAFQLQIDKEKLTDFARDAMVIQIIDGSGSIKQKEIFNCGVEDTIDHELHGDFMNILKWEVNKNSNTIDISIIFRLRSNSCILEIYFISASSKQIRMKINKDLNLAKRIYRSIIILSSSSKLDFSIHSSSSNNGEFKKGDIIIASCRAYDGIPKEIPKFENYQNLSIIESLFSIETNERTIKFRVRKSDHLMKLGCLTGTVSKTHIIKVFHNPTRLYFKPDIKSTLPPNSTIFCFAEGGYPIPKLQWILVDGPFNSSQFYEIDQNKTQLHMNNKSPIKSKWKFSCSIKNFNIVSGEKLTATISFLIESNITRHCDIQCVNIRLLNLEYLTNKTRNKSEKYFHSKILEIEKYSNASLNQVKQENIILKQRIDLFEQNKNAEIQNFKKKWKQQLESQISKISRNNENLNKTIENKSYKINELKQRIELFEQTKNIEIQKLKIEWTKQLERQIKKVSRDNENINNTIKNKNTEIQNFKNEWTKQLENQINRISRDNKNLNKKIENTTIQIEQIKNVLKYIPKSRPNDLGWTCRNYSRFGEIETKGENGEIHEWIIKGFKKITIETRDIYSPAFYSFYFGYNMQLYLHKAGSHMQLYFWLYFYLLRGEFDADLPWPMRHEIKISIKNQINGESDFLTTSSYDTASYFYRSSYQKPGCDGNYISVSYYFISLEEFYKKESKKVFNDSIVLICEVIKKHQ